MNGIRSALLVVALGALAGGCAVPRNEADVTRSTLGQEATVKPAESRLLGIDERSREVERNVGVR